MPFYFGDWTYYVFVIPMLVFALIASARVNSTFNKYSRVASRRGLTGADAARAVLMSNGVTDVRIEHVSGKLTDHYDPKNKVIRLSDAVYSSNSVASLGVAAHEAGHAVQYAEDYAPARFRNAIIPVTNIGSKLAIPLIILGIALTYFGEQFIWVAYAGIICFGFSVLFQLFTLSSEFDASSRALKALGDTGALSNDELPGAKRVLSAAAMTYVAALATAIAQLLRLIVIVNRNRD